MSERRLSLPEFAALVALAMEGTEISNPDLKERHGLSIDGAKRRRLNDLKLVESWKQGRSNVHMLTDSGWARLQEDLHEGRLPAMTGSPAIIARGLHHWLRRYMDRSELRLAEVSMPEETAPHGGETAMDRPSGETTGSDRPHGDLEARIRAAYAQLAPQAGSWVGLARLRPLLGDTPKTEVDAALVRMERLPDVNLVPESNQKASASREAGVSIGGQEKHLLWIGEA